MFDVLPYDLGNAGDLLKHGFLAEYAAWWIRSRRRELRFADPFGGVPWQEPPAPGVTRRIQGLAGTALHLAQSALPQRYYGSAHLMLRIGCDMHGKIEVLVSDQDAARRVALQNSSLSLIEIPHFDPANGYSILRTELAADLVLIDPFDDFLAGDYASTLHDISLGNQKGTSVLLFVLHSGADHPLTTEYWQIRRRVIPEALVGTCRPIPFCGIRGESKFIAEVVLAFAGDVGVDELSELRRVFENYCARLSSVLCAEFDNHPPPLGVSRMEEGGNPG
jgi:hypothetical protein